MTGHVEAVRAERLAAVELERLGPDVAGAVLRRVGRRVVGVDRRPVALRLALERDEHLASRPQIVAFNKTDQPQAQERWPGLKAELERRGYEVFAMSALTRQGTAELPLPNVCLSLTIYGS